MVDPVLIQAQAVTEITRGPHSHRDREYWGKIRHFLVEEDLRQPEVNNLYPGRGTRCTIREIQ